MRNKLVILFFLFSAISVAQIPGYMGKRFSINYSANLSPSYLYPSTFSGSEDLGLNHIHCLDLNYVIKPRTAICLGAQYSATGIEMNHYYSEDNTLYYMPSNNIMKVREINYALGFKFFSRGMFAPLGSYRKLEFVFINAAVLYDPNEFYVNESSNGLVHGPVVGNGKINVRSWTITYTLGKQRILKDAIIIDTGIRFGVVPNYVAKTLFDFSSLNGTLESVVKPTVSERLFGQQLVALHLGIGFLAF